VPPPSRLHAAKQLVVEGKSAEYFFSALLAQMGVSDVQVQDFGSVGELGRFLKALCSMSGFSTVVSLGIVRDAESDPRAALQSVCTALGHADLPTPEAPGPAKGTRPRVSAFILPDETTAGMLEDLCLRSVAEQPVMECVDEYFGCLDQRCGLALKNIPKARVQAYLASQLKAGLLLGQAAHAGYWPWDHPAFDDVKRFLGNL